MEYAIQTILIILLAIIAFPILKPLIIFWIIRSILQVVFIPADYAKAIAIILTYYIAKWYDQ